jgi:inosose dehydratase
MSRFVGDNRRASLVERAAGGPISWGICEVPGWGTQLSIDRVLGEMRDVGLRATELGAAGWLPEDPTKVREILGRYGLRAIAAFVPLVLHDPAQRAATLKYANETADLLANVGATTFVTAVVSNDWRHFALSADQWQHVYSGLKAVDDIVAQRGLQQAVHPHVDTLVEQNDEVERVLENTDVSFCLDTGHLAIGGTDPLEFAEAHADRVGHVHLKDVRLEVAARLRSGALSLMEAVQAGVFTPLGQGNIALEGVVVALENSGYEGWYVLEQDVALSGEPPAGDGPIAGVRESVDYLRDLASKLAPADRVSK